LYPPGYPLESPAKRHYALQFKPIRREIPDQNGMKNRLKRLRAIKGWIQAELATQLGVFRQTIIAMEKVSSTRACRWPLKQPGYLNCRSKKYSTIKIQIRGEYGRSGVVLFRIIHSLSGLMQPNRLVSRFIRFKTEQ
jgi:hypothetical protein